MKLEQFEKNIEVIMGGMNGEIIMLGERDVEIDDLSKEKYMFEYNSYLDMLLVSDVDGYGVLYYNKEVSPDYIVYDVMYGQGDSFFDTGKGSVSELSHRILEDDEIDELLN